MFYNKNQKDTQRVLGGGEVNNTIAMKLITLRGSKSRKEVAKSVGISISALQMYENGRRIPRDDIKIRLANFYGVSVDYLFFSHLNHESCSGTNLKPTGTEGGN